MQKIAAYVLERRENMSAPEVRESEGTRIRGAIAGWLQSKGAKGGNTEGTFEAEDGAKATYKAERVADDGRSWDMFRLDEITDDGRHFATLVSVTVGHASVTVYLTMEAGSTGAYVRPVDVSPHCPRIIRDLLALGGPWYQGSSILRKLRIVEGFEGGEELSSAIISAKRTLPFVVISRVQGAVALPKLDEKLAFDLAGLANVFVVDEGASWALTDAFGKNLSCFGQGVRVYWPGVGRDADPARHPLWTGRRLTTLADSPHEARERFRRHMRARMMRAAALGVLRPKEIDEIRNAATRAIFAAMKAKATSRRDFEELANSYADDNEGLRTEKAELESRIAELQMHVAELEEEKSAILIRAKNAELQLRYTPDATEDIAPDAEEDEDDDEPGPPRSGEIRFYKKRYAAPKRDVLVRVGDCGHTSWQGAAKADKAKKGISHLEGGRRNWQKVQHCGTCTGGGMWRVCW